MHVLRTEIPDVKIIKPCVFKDERGFFMETFRESWFKKECENVEFVQDNHSKSSQGILRGLHYQLENTQGKLVRVVNGEIFDVAVDMRKESATFGHWLGVILNSENQRQMWVPSGFAHGFYVMSETADVMYKCTNYYHPESEVTVKYDDADIGIIWPFIDGVVSQISEKDSEGIAFSKAPTL